MGFFRKLFLGREISSEENERRMHGANENGNKYFPKPVEEMTEDEMVSSFFEIKDIEDITERIKLMSILGNAGLKTAFGELRDDYIVFGKETGRFQWEKINYWAEKAADADLLISHYMFASLLMNENNPHADFERAEDELVKGVECGEQLSCEEILAVINSLIDNPEDYELVRNVFWEKLDPVAKRLEAIDTDRAQCARGLMYFYGLYYPQDLDQAKKLFLMACEKNYNMTAHMMLGNPLFDENDDDEDE